MTSSDILDSIEEGYFDIDTIDQLIESLCDEGEIDDDYDKIPDRY
jgi:hypothetical protein